MLNSFAVIRVGFFFFFYPASSLTNHLGQPGELEKLGVSTFLLGLNSPVLRPKSGGVFLIGSTNPPTGDITLTNPTLGET